MNKITISGLVCSEVEYYYEYYGEKFYTFFIVDLEITLKLLYKSTEFVIDMHYYKFSAFLIQ